MFSTVHDVRNALTPGAVETDTTTAASLSDEQLADAIAEADSRIQSYLPQDYTVPTVMVEYGDPPEPAQVAFSTIRFWSRDIAAYFATLTYNRGRTVNEDDPVRLRYNAVMETLREVRDGKISLPPDADTTDDTHPGAVVVHNRYEGDLFSMDDFGLGPVPPGMTRYRARTLGIW